MKFVRNMIAAVCAAGCFLGLTPMLAFAEVKDENGNVIETVNCGEFEYSVMVDSEEGDGRAACVEKYNGSAEDVVIPEQMNGLTVIAIGDSAFAGNYTIRSVTLPSSLMGIGTHAFAECTALENYYVAENSAIFSSKDGVLYAHDDTWLVRYPIPKIPAELEIPEGVVLIGDNAFSYSDVLTSVKFPSTLKTIAAAAFSNDIALTEITIPETVTSIPDFCFYGCSALSSVTLHDNITGIGEGAFAMTALEKFTIPAACTYIDQIAFAQTKLSYIKIPSTVTEIGDLAFGYRLNVRDELAADQSFTIYGDIGSAAETYAKDVANGNLFNFIAIGDVANQTTDVTTTAKSEDAPDAADSTDETTTTTTKASESALTTTEPAKAVLPSKTRNLMITVIACGAAVLIGIIAAIVAVLRKQKKS